jgi:predicted MFS family arabinose efflux permease
MHEALAVSTDVLGALASANYLGYLVGAIAAAAIPAGRGLYAILRWSLLTVVLVTALMAASSSIPIWFVLRFVAGVASAGVFVCASAVVLQQIGRAGRVELAGRFFGGVGAGIAVSGAVVLVVVRLAHGSQHAWRLEWLAVAALAAVLTVPSLLWLRPVLGVTPGPAIAKAPAQRGQRHRRPIVLLGTAYFLEAIGYIVAGTFLVAIVAAGPQSAEAATTAWIVVGLTAAPSALVWSWLAQRWALMPALSLAYIAQAIGLLLTPRDDAWLVAAALLGGTFVGVTSLTITGSRALVEPRQATRAIAILTAVFGFGQIIGPLLATALADDQAGLARSMPVAAGLVMLGAVLVLLAGRLVPTAGTTT